MIAVDTNILVRLLVGDDEKQTGAASALLAAEQFWVAKTVLLETSWVLRKTYGFDEKAARQALSGLLGLDQVVVEDQAGVVAAFVLASEGVDFADALHLSSRPPGAPFMTFDRALVSRAKRAGQAGVRELSARRSAP